MDQARIPIEELITIFKSTITVEDVFEKLKGWHHNDAQPIQLEHYKDHSLRKLLLHCENPIVLKEKVQSIDNKLLNKFIDLIQEVSEDKKLAAFLEKRCKEYDRELSSEIVHYKNEIEKRNELQKQQQMKKSKKAVLKKHIDNQTPLWKNLRKYQALDYFNIPTTHTYSNHTCPEEKDLIDDVLSCLQGFRGKYITPNKFDTPLIFNIHESINSQYKCLMSKILKLASAYIVICRFCEDNHQSNNGYVNQALSCYLSKFIRDYLNFVICLENQHKSGELSLQSLSFAAQTHVYKMEFVARIVSIITHKKKKGGQTLSVLHDEVIQCFIDEPLKKLLAGMVEVSTIPFFKSLEKWIFKGQVFDPCDEFMIKSGKLMLSDDTEKYWNRCYTVRNEYVPSYLEKFKEIILRTGKYLNALYHCNYTNFQPPSNLLGIQSFCLGLKTQWPVSLIFNENVISNYQMLFRLLLLCKNVERQLLKIWLCDKQLNVPSSSAITYKKAFNLRQNMLLFVQNLEYYMFEEVIETQWHSFMSAIQFNVKNVDELLDEQQKFLNLCLKNCMVTNPDLMKNSRYLLELCTEFSDYILSPKKHLNFKLDFEKNIQILENKFTAAMIDLLKCIRKMSRLDSGNIIYNFLYRMDFNGMYTEQINMDDTILYT